MEGYEEPKLVEISTLAEAQMGCEVGSAYMITVLCATGAGIGEPV
jgi:hypothetical protein